jgi:hypothetical protein
MVWETGDRTTRSSVHTLADADAIEKCWAAIGKKVPTVVNYANFYRTPATAARKHPTGSTGSGDDGSDATLKVIRAVVGARTVGCDCCPPEMTVAVGGQFYDSSPSSSTGRWALLLVLALPARTHVQSMG